MKWMTTAAALALTATLGACSSDNPREAVNDAQDAATEALPDVNWSQHAPDQQKIIDKAARNENCKLLQDTFDVQADRDGADPDLLDYIDAKLREAGCYD